MNIFLIIIIIALVAEYFLGIVSNVLNLRALKPEPPEQLQDIYDPEQYKKSQQYTRVNTGYDMITGTFNLAVLLTFWFFGGFWNLRPSLREKKLYLPVQSSKT